MAQHGRRITDFTRGRRLGKHDHIVQWPRPPKPKTMSAQEYARYPAFLWMREVEVNGRILVTTLRDPKFVPARALGTLYKMRWNIEVDFRTIKATLQMDVLRCKSQPMVDKEIAVCFLAYNLGSAGRWRRQRCSRTYCHARLRFTGAKRLLNAFADQLRRAPGDQVRTLIACRAWLHRHTATAASTRPDRATRKETAPQKYSAVNRAASHRSRPHSYPARA